MSRVSKREDMFYTLLQELSREIVKAAELYDKIISEYPVSEQDVKVMKDIEVECDEMVDNILQQLYESFITPFDREDIFELVQRMDNVVDNMEHIVRRFTLYHVSSSRPESVELAHITLEATRQLEDLFVHLPAFKKDKTVMDDVRSVHHIEDRGDDVYHDALARLFDETDSTPTHLLKWKSIFDRMEDTIDECKYIATIVSNVVLKNA